MIFKSGEIKDDSSLGGKGKGLNFLFSNGFHVPEFLVITPGGQTEFFKNSDQYLNQLNSKPKAVRSSGMKEDGDEQSFAGQYETFLGLNDDKEIVEAVKKCIESGSSDRVKEYDTNTESSDNANPDRDQVAVIIQDMVDAKYAGVAFSSDPVRNRRDLISINAVKGLGDKLVDGKAQSDQVYLNKYDKSVDQNLSEIVSKEVLIELKEGIKKLTELLNKEVDVEWAVDKENKLNWLQVRPITTGSDFHANELDSGLADENEILTRANIGEMMPGYLTPLSISTFGRAIEYGIQDFYMQCGIQKEIVEGYHYIKYFYNHGFISLTGLYKIADGMLLPKNEYIEYSILGRSLGGKSIWKKRGFFKQLINQKKQFSYLGKSKKRLEDLKKMAEEVTYPLEVEASVLYNWIDQELNNLNLAYSYHYNTSAKSGSQYSALISVISGSPKPTPESNTYASNFLSNIEGIVGADSIKQLKNLAKSIKNNFKDYDQKSNQELLDFLQSDKGETGKLYSKFIEDHGHRCVREAELKEKDWSQVPIRLIPVLKGMIKADNFESKQEKFDMKEALAKLPKMNKLKKTIIKKLANSTREAVAMREESKSAAIKFQQEIKFAYLDLASKMFGEGILESEEDIFYLTHSEIGQVLKSGLKDYKIRIEKRKELDAEYEKMEFQEVYYGHPYPVNGSVTQDNSKGTVVSQGKTEGKLRIVRSLEEADKLEPGDIMVCQYTDIGWSPYFAIISGIITEIGSPLSHGAVVAREYGIPAIVNMHNAMEILEDGQEVVMDTNADEFIRHKKREN